MRTLLDVVHAPKTDSGAIRGAVIVVVHRSNEHLAACLESLRTSLAPGVVVIVCDNASIENVARAQAPAFPEVHFLRSEENRGFAGGNNLAADYACQLGAGLLYFLNDDTEVATGFWEACEEAVQVHGAGIVGSVIVHFARPTVIQSAGVRTDRVHMREEYRGVEAKYGPPFAGYFSCDAVLGAGLMVRSDVFSRLGGFDESYFHLQEEIDFCLRARSLGIEVGCAGGSIIRHKSGGTLQPATPRYTFLFYRNWIWLWRRNTSPLAFWRHGPLRLGRHLINHFTGRSWLTRTFPNLLAATAGTLAGGLSRRRRILRRISNLPASAARTSIESTRTV